VLEQSLRAFDSGEKPPASAEDARDALEVIDACYSSAVTGMRTQVGSLTAAARS
jgi:predicted dehydrogenase